MRTLKKALALVVVLSMALGTMATAVQYKDVADDYDYAQAITLLSDLGVLLGDESGFRPEATITRAESCAVVYRMMTGTTYANNYAGATDFSDVAANHWASGYINYCSTFGIVNGYPDGTFLPDAPVTFGEMVTMIVRALGCDKDDDGDALTLTFPTGYMGVAQQQGVLESGMTLKADDNAYRGLVAELVYNATFEAQYKRAGYMWSKSDGYYYQTIAEKVFGMVENTGIVAAYGDYSFLSDDACADLDGDEVVIAYYEDGSLYDDGKLNVRGTYTYDDLDVAQYLFRAVKYWVNDDKEIVAITLSDNNAVMTVNAADVAEADAAGKVTINDKDYSYGNVDDTGMVCVNYDPDLTEDLMLAHVDVPIDQNAAITYIAISNDGKSSSIDAVIALVYSLAEVTAMEDDEMEYSIKTIATVEGDDFYINGIDEDDLAGSRLEADDVTADLDEVAFTNYTPEEDDVVMYVYYPLANDGDGEFDMQLVTEVEGKYTSKSTTAGTFTIGGTAYKFATGDEKMDGITTNTGVTVQKLPIFGYIYDAEETEADSETTNVYLVTKMGVDSDSVYGDDSSYYLTAWGTDGKEAEYEIKSTAKFYYDETHSATISAGADVPADGQTPAVPTTTVLEQSGSKWLLNDNCSAGNLVSAFGAKSEDGLQMYLAYLTFNSSKQVTAVKPLTVAFTSAALDNTPASTVSRYSKTSGLLYLSGDAGNHLIKSDSVTFFWNEDDNEAIVYNGSFPSEADNGLVSGYYRTNKSYSPIVAALFAGEPAGNVDTDTYFGIILGSETQANPDDEDESCAVFTMMVNGEIKTYSTEMGDNDLIDNLCDSSIAKPFYKQTGAYTNAVLYFELNSDGKITLQGDDYSDTFELATGYNSDGENEDLVRYGSVTEDAGNYLVNVADESFEVASDCDVYMTTADHGDWAKTTVSSLSKVLATSDGKFTRTALLIFSDDPDGSDAEDAEVVAIFYFQNDIRSST